MTRRKREHPEAQAELREAATWYDDEEPGLGDDLIGAIDATLRDVLEWPRAAPTFEAWVGPPTVRSKRVPVFPYRMMYYVSDTEIVILAYAHLRREPGYWKHRLE